MSKLNFYKLIPHVMDTQDPSNRPRYQLTRVLVGLDNEKRCYDVTLSRQEGSTMRHLASAQEWDWPAGGNTGRLFLTFGGPVCADWISNCPLSELVNKITKIFSRSGLTLRSGNPLRP